MARTIEARVIQKVDTEANWMANPLLLYQGEVAFVSDKNNFKLNTQLQAKTFAELEYYYKGDILGGVLPTDDLASKPNGVYRATISGTYGSVVVKEGYYTLLRKDNGVWKLESEVEMPTLSPTGKVEEGNTEAVSGGEVSSVFNEIGVLIEEPSSYNPIEPLFGLPRTDLETNPIWGEGYLNTEGVVRLPEVVYWIYTKDFYPLPKGWWRHNLYMQEGRCLCLYDENEDLIETISINNDNPSSVFSEFYMPVDGFFRFSYPTTIDANPAILSLEERTFISISKAEITDDVFVKTETFDGKLNTKLKDEFGVEGIEEYTEFISELVGSDVDNTDLWSRGFLTSDGGLDTSGSFVHSVKYYPIKAGSYEYRMFFNGNARMIYYDNNYNIIRDISGPTSVVDHTRTVTLESDGYIRISFRYGVQTASTDLIYFKNTTEIRPAIITDINIEDFLPEPPSTGKQDVRQVYLDTFRAKKKRPLVTLIADDGMIQNLEWYKSILDEFKVKSTFAIVGEWTKKADNGELPSVIPSAKLRELFLDGHDIASHTWTHTQQWNTVLTLEQIEEEFSRNKVFLETITDTPVNMFISPFGLRSATVDRLVSKYYDANFITLSGRNELPLDNFFLKRVSFDGSETEFSLSWEDKLKPAIDSAIANNEWVIFSVHPQYLQYRNGHNPDYLARREELRTLLQYCKDNNVEVVTAKKGYEYYKNHIDIGVKRVDAKYYKLSMDMTEENVNYF